MLTGCASRVTEYQVGANGRLRKMGTFTEEESWKRIVEQQIDREVAGEPPVGSPTWEESWRTWYANIRRHPRVYFKSAELKTTEDMVAYMKKRRSARGLPPFE